jgi:hypothetical protein
MASIVAEWFCTKGFRFEKSVAMNVIYILLRDAARAYFLV